MTDAVYTIDDANNLCTGDMTLNINNADVIHYMLNEEKQPLLVFYINGKQVALPFSDEERRKIMFDEIQRRRLLWAKGKEAFGKYIKEQKKLFKAVAAEVKA